MSRKYEQLGDLVEIRAGYSSRKGYHAATPGTHWLLQIGDFDPDRTHINVDGMIRVDPEGMSSLPPLQAGDVLFLAKGRKPFGYVAPELPKPTIAAGYFFVLKLKAAVAPEYLAWFLSHDATRRYLAAQSGSGVHMPVVRRDVLEHLRVPLPPIEHQRAIVALDALARHEAALMAEMRELRRALMSKVTITVAEGQEERT